MIAELKTSGSNTLIIDMRNNTGGDSEIFNPLLKEIINNNKINKRGHLYVIVGRETFSAAIMDTMRLKLKTKAIFVGEETGGSPNRYGNVKTISIPSLDMTVSYSTDYFKTSLEDVHTFTPDIIVSPKASSFFAGKDDFLEVVFKDMESR